MDISTIILFCSVLSSTLRNSAAVVDTIRAHQFIRDGETITSAGGDFELGFFSPGRSPNRYLGIWYKKISNGTVVWVANRDIPIMNHSGMVSVNNKGITLQTLNGIIWSSNLSLPMKNPVAQLLDSGNLILRYEDHDINNAENFVWQSFDHPGDTLLPGMKLGVDLVTGLNRYTSSWKSVDDPSTGSFTDRLDPNGFPQLFLSKGSIKWSRTGPWNGRQFNGYPKSKPNGIYTVEFIFNKKEMYCKFELINITSAVMRLTWTPNGELKLLVWNYQDQIWIVYITLKVSDCDRYRLCGSYGICNINSSPRCECLRGFTPEFPDKWKGAEWSSSGCVRKISLDCNTEAGFVKYAGVKLPDTRHSWYDMRINLKECRKLCMKNCSCTAYANADVRNGGSGCILWSGDLTDMTYTENGQDIYVRMPASELVDGWRSRLKKHIWIIFILVVLVPIFFYVLRSRKRMEVENLKSNPESVVLNEVEGEDIELQLVDFKRIVKATDNFSNDLKLGEGGFGAVYKGMWNDGQEIAVKRLSKNSNQGLNEFINEVSCIAKLQHRNLVTLLGCCTEKGERILIYEYMANKSLDSIIFDEEMRNTMDWPKRYSIIHGIGDFFIFIKIQS